MADRETFPYQEDWRADLPVLMQQGIIQKIAAELTGDFTMDPDGVAEGLHCRVIWSKWDFSNGGEQFLNIEYKYPSALAGENDVGYHSVSGELLQIDDPEVLSQLVALADTRTVETWSTASGEFVPAQ